MSLEPSQLLRVGGRIQIALWDNEAHAYTWHPAVVRSCTLGGQIVQAADVTLSLEDEEGSELVRDDYQELLFDSDFGGGGRSLGLRGYTQ